MDSKEIPGATAASSVVVPEKRMDPRKEFMEKILAAAAEGNDRKAYID